VIGMDLRSRLVGGAFILPPLFLLLLWQYASTCGFVSKALFPPPTDILSAFFELAVSGELSIHLQASLWRVLMGLGLGGIAGASAGLLTGRVKLIDHSLGPVLNLLRSFPPVALIPFIIVWFGIGDGAKVFSITFAVFFPVWVSTHSGASNIPPRYIQAASTLSKSAVKVWLRVIMPASMPFIIAGARTGIGVAYIMVFVSELAGASSGLGYLIAVSQLSYRIDRMIATLFVLGLLGAATDQAFTYSVRRLFPWAQMMG